MTDLNDQSEFLAPNKRDRQNFWTGFWFGIGAGYLVGWATVIAAFEWFLRAH